MRAIIELTPCYLDKAMFLRLAKDYIETLKKYDSALRWDEAAWNDAMWNSVFIIEDRVIQGFIFKQEISFKLYGDVMYIAEFYVAPDARRRGVGMEAVKKLVEQWSGDVFLYVLNSNFAAKAFWKAVEDNLGWRRIHRPELRQEPGCEIRVFAQTKR